MWKMYVGYGYMYFCYINLRNVTNIFRELKIPYNYMYHCDKCQDICNTHILISTSHDIMGYDYF